MQIASMCVAVCCTGLWKRLMRACKSYAQKPETNECKIMPESLRICEGAGGGKALGSEVCR